MRESYEQCATHLFVQYGRVINGVFECVYYEQLAVRESTRDNFDILAIFFSLHDSYQKLEKALAKKYGSDRT